jgi:predicted dehydrogenase
MRLAIVGAGYGLQAHLPAFRSINGVSVDVVINTGTSKANLNLPEGVRYSAFLEEALSTKIDAVCIAVPPALQMNLALEVLGANKHLLCEKPFGMSAFETHRIFAKAKDSSQLVVAVNFQYRFEPMIQALRDLIRTGRLGRLQWIDIEWLTAGGANSSRTWTWRNSASDGGGALRAFACHVIDLVIWLTSQKVKTTTADTQILIPKRPHGDTGTERQVTAEDLVVAQLQLDECVAHIRITNCQPGGRGMKIEVGGSHGVAVLRNKPPYERQTLEVFGLNEGISQWSAAIGTGETSADTRVPALSALASAFYAAVTGFTPIDLPRVGDAYAVQSVMQAVYESSRLGRTIPVNG